ncbi:hypothetical protein [Actinomadura monticuli]|uniref:Dihydrodipicolinate reductase N-terminal domain-containing protein n=1 Tax=Actinomadura monticuli TaxID=3097367 RepID=A0ABV4Q4L0_9ACTN
MAGMGGLGTPIVQAVLHDPGLRLTGVASRSRAGMPLTAALGAGSGAEAVRGSGIELRISADTETALRAGADVLVDVTTPRAGIAHATAALDQGVNVLLAATSAGTESSLGALEALARTRGKALAWVPNLSLTCALLERSLAGAAPWADRVELIDHAGPHVHAPLHTTASLAGICRAAGLPTEVRSIREGGRYSAVRAVLHRGAESLELQHATPDSEAYVTGALHAVRQLPGRNGLLRGMTWAL